MPIHTRTLQLTPYSTVILEKLIVPQLIKIFPAFYGKTKGSLQCSQQPATYPYHEPDKSSPRPSSYLLKIQFNIVLQFAPRPSKWFLYLRLPTTNPICTPLSPHSRPYHSSSFDHRNSIWWGLQIVQLYSMQFPPVPCYLVPLRLNISTLFSYIFSLRSSLSVSDQVSHPYKTAGKFIVHTHTHTHTHTHIINRRTLKEGFGDAGQTFKRTPNLFVRIYEMKKWQFVQHMIPARKNKTRSVL